MLGVSEPYAANIRAGRHRSHPKHWETLAALAGIVPGDRIVPRSVVGEIGDVLNGNLLWDQSNAP